MRLCSNAIWVPVWLLYLNSGKPTYIASLWKPRFPVFFTDYPLTKRTDHGRLEQSCYYSGVFFTSSVYTICNVSPPSRQSGTLGPNLLLHIFANNPQPEAISPEFLFLRKTSNILKLLEPSKTCYGCSNRQDFRNRMFDWFRLSQLFSFDWTQSSSIGFDNRLTTSECTARSCKGWAFQVVPPKRTENPNSSALPTVFFKTLQV